MIRGETYLLGLYFIALVVISYFTTKKYIGLVKDKIQQPFLEGGPEHSQKAGTPTMGGLSFIAVYLFGMIAVVLPLMLFGKLGSQSNNIMNFVVLIFVVLGYFIIGFKDDYQKVTLKENTLGLSPKQKILGQLIVGLIVSVFLYFTVSDTNIDFFINNKFINLGLFYYMFVPFVMIAMSNASNLTDGLDGLLTNNIILTLVSLTIIANYQGEYLFVFSNITLIAALLGFLYWNFNPARVFMGDVGSLVLGAYVAYVAIYLKVELLLLLLGFVYVMETLSVILQMSYFKYTKKKYSSGKRLFLMAPLHHHFEKKGYNERKVVLIFLGINFVCNVLGILLYFK